MELDSKLNLVGTEPVSGHMREQETGSERKGERERKKKKGARMRECVFV